MLKARLLQFIKNQGITVSKFESVVGLSNGAVSRTNDRMRQRTVDAIASAFPQLNTHWLLTGEGEMIAVTQNPSSDSQAKISYESGVPYYDEDFVLGFTEMGFPSSENPQFLVQMPRYANATLWCNATGHSMEPEINNGDVIALQLIEDPSFLLMGDLYAIVTTNGLRTIKRLGKGEDKDHYRLIPTNKEYDEQQIPKRVILRVFRVLGSLHSF